MSPPKPIGNNSIDKHLARAYAFAQRTASKALIAAQSVKPQEIAKDISAGVQEASQLAQGAAQRIKSGVQSIKSSLRR